MLPSVSPTGIWPVSNCPVGEHIYMEAFLVCTGIVALAEVCISFRG